MFNCHQVKYFHDLLIKGSENEVYETWDEARHLLYRGGYQVENYFLFHLFILKTDVSMHPTYG